MQATNQDTDNTPNQDKLELDQNYSLKNKLILRLVKQPTTFVYIYTQNHKVSNRVNASKRISSMSYLNSES